MYQYQFNIEAMILLYEVLSQNSKRICSWKMNFVWKARYETEEDYENWRMLSAPSSKLPKKNWFAVNERIIKIINNWYLQIYTQYIHLINKDTKRASKLRQKNIAKIYPHMIEKCFNKKSITCNRGIFQEQN